MGKEVEAGIGLLFIPYQNIIELKLYNTCI